jgi:hypothetical protein
MIMTLLPLVAGLALFIGGAALLYRRARQMERNCPNCHAEYELISAAGDGPNASYDVLACPFCVNTSTRVHGTQSELAWCPACRNQTLETPSLRLPGEGRRIEVREHCGICEFERSYVVGEGEIRPLGRVIPFPFERTRRAKEDAEKAEKTTGG